MGGSDALTKEENVETTSGNYLKTLKLGKQIPNLIKIISLRN